MNITVWILVALAAGIVLGWVVCWLWLAARRPALALERDAALERVKELRQDRETMLNSYHALSAQALERQTKTVEDAAAQRLSATEYLMTPVRLSLEKLESRLADVEKDRIAMSSEIANQVRSVQSTGEQLRRETSALATALRKPQVRGAWGEMQLKRVVEIAGMVEHCDFLTQVSSATDERSIRPDMRVELAGGKFVLVDAKTPLEGFLDAELIDSADDRARHMAAFGRHVRTHVDQLSTKGYWKADTGTPEFVILFLPSEALFSAAVDQSPDLIEYAASRNVMLASPTTLITMLRTIAYAWNQEVLADSAKELSSLGRQLYERLGTMGSHFDKLGRSLDASVRSYNEAIGSLEGRVLVSARRFKDMGVSEDELKDATPITSVARQVTAPELVASAVDVPALVGRTLTRMPVVGDVGQVDDGEHMGHVGHMDDLEGLDDLEESGRRVLTG
ncbi:MAG: DNA recombination protein RmuC [Propionibacteriaceae bacterium]|nr:DNA recombination protein RmuC [Propionibacteriaceae bacterium]